MSRALVIDFHMPFAPRPEGLAEIFTDDFIELFHKHELHSTIILSGLFLQRAAKSRGVITALAALARDGKIELACEPLGAPLPGGVSANDLAKLVTLSQQWSEDIFGSPIRATCLDYRYPCGELFPLLQQQNLEHVIIAPLYPRRAHPRTSLQLRQLRGELRLSVLSQMKIGRAHV